MQKYKCNYYTDVNVKCNVNFCDKTENKMKNIMIQHENIIGKVNKILEWFKGLIKFIRALELTIRIQGRVHKNIVNVYSKSDGIPILWKKHYLKITHDRYYKHNQRRRMRYVHDFTRCNGCFSLCNFILYK